MKTVSIPILAHAFGNKLFTLLQPSPIGRPRYRCPQRTQDYARIAHTECSLHEGKNFPSALQENTSTMYMKRITNYFPWTIITVGIILRLSLFMVNRSLYIDEADLIGNITHRTFMGLTKPLDEKQNAPIGFLWFEKAALISFGDSEYTFRLYALLMGIASLFLFYKVSHKLLSHRAALIALSLFTFSHGLIRYSSEAKQYMGDVAISLLLLYLTVLPKRISELSAAFIGALVFWFSHASTFIVCSIGISRWKKLLWAIPIWIASFSLEYFIILRYSINDSDLGPLWISFFAPFPPRSISDLQKTGDIFLRYLSYIFFFPHTLFLIFSVLLMILGIITFWGKNRTATMTLILPFLLVYIASGYHAYPLAERLLLFLAPLIFLLVAYGADVVLSLSQKIGQAARLTVVTLLLTILLYRPIINATTNLFHPPVIEEIKPVLSFYKTHRDDQDILYVSSGAQSAFRYYEPKFGLDRDHIVYGGYVRNHADEIINEITSLEKNSRVWVLFSHMNSASRKDIQLIIDRLIQTKKMILFRQSVGAAVYLFDLR